MSLVQSFMSSLVSFPLLGCAFLLPGCLEYCAGGETVRHESILVEAPFDMPPIQVPVFPDHDFVVTQFGAKENEDITEAISKAIAFCHKAGGGRVVVPEGKWTTGAIHLKSLVNLHLQKGALLTFTDSPEDYLPAVQTSWEGMECFNYSPLVYALDCENVAITGDGTLRAEMGTWKEWSGRPPAHLEASKRLYHMVSTDVPVKDRQMAKDDANMRPQFIQFNRCKNVLIEDVRIRNSPFWTVHLLLCESVVVRGVDIVARGHNNDGIDPEMSRNLLIENCTFDQGDDAIAIKAGRNRDGWRLNRPTENVVIQNCTMRQGHQLVAIGTELSGGVRNVVVRDCHFEKTTPFNLLFIKTNRRRGGFVRNIFVENITADGVKESAFGIETDVLYQWRNLVPTYEEKVTEIRDIYVRNITIDKADSPFRILGDEKLPVQNVCVENLTIRKAQLKRGRIENVTDLRERNLNVNAR